MKPHEEDWVLQADDAESAPEIWRKDGGLLFTCNDAQRGALATAAPDMARALLDHVLIRGGPDDAHAHTKPCWASRMERTRQRLGGACTADCSAVRAALAKTGVPLP